MKVLVTGAAGFVGKNLVLELKDKGYDIAALIRTEADQGFLKIHQIKTIVGDITNAESVDSAIKDCDIVFNLAAALPHHNLAEADYWQTNVEGLKNILESCRKYKIKRLVHVSTVGIYDQRVTAYTKTKTEGERLINEYRKKHRLPVVIVRPTIAYGPYDTRPGFFNLFPLIHKGLFIPIGTGQNYFHSVYVGNLVQALIDVAKNNKAIGDDFIIGDDPCPKMRDIVQTIAEVEGKSLPSFYLPLPLALLLGKIGDLIGIFGLSFPLSTRRVKFITDTRKYDLSEVKEKLNYVPKFSLRQGIEKTFQWYKDQGYIK